MDYGQSASNLDKEPFFTPGSGSISENLNPDTGANLNSENYSISRDLKAVGNTAIFSANQDISQSPQSESGINPLEHASSAQINDNSAATASDIEQAVDWAMPPNISESVPQDNPRNLESIKTTEKLNKSGIKEIDNAVLKFKQDGNAADFYNSARDMMEQNIKNSYGELASWKGGSE